MLQCLFANPTFRAGIYAAEPAALAASAPLRELRCVAAPLLLRGGASRPPAKTGFVASEALTRRAPRSTLFGKLQAGVRQSADPAAFAKSLTLDSNVQQVRMQRTALPCAPLAVNRPDAASACATQDGQEFMKLLLTMLDRALAGSSAGKCFVGGLFCGRASYETTCCHCGSQSAASAAAVDFHELELNVAGFPSVEASMADLLVEEALEGDNLYACEAPPCAGARREARRMMRLRNTPPVLSLHLKRFVYDTRTWARKKVSAKFAIPRVLDLQGLLRPAAGDPASEDSQYDLAAILVHKGTAATSGHYGALPPICSFADLLPQPACPR